MCREIDLVVDELETEGALAPQSMRRIVELIQRFGRYVVGAHGISSLRDVRVGQAHAFVEAGGQTGAPANATMHLRRSAIRTCSEPREPSNSAITIPLSI
jgi:hypothetical protein